jgi:hypothetical protein
MVQSHSGVEVRQRQLVAPASYGQVIPGRVQAEASAGAVAGQSAAVEQSKAPSTQAQLVSTGVPPWPPPWTKAPAA